MNLPQRLLKARGWLFDLDGTLLDSTAGVVRAFHAAQQALGEAAADPEAIRRRIGYPLSETIKKLSGAPPGPFLEHFRAEALRSMADLSSLLPGARALLSALDQRDSRLAVVTSKRRDVALLVLEKLGILHLFQTVVGSDCASEVKPSPAPVLLALRRLELSAEEVVMVGDTQNDVASARAAGTLVIALATGIDDASRLSGADLLLPDASSLHALVEAEITRPAPPIVYGRPDCPLCDQLKETLRARRLAFRERSILGSDVWYERYAESIPVVVAQGREFWPPFDSALWSAWTQQSP